MVNTLLDPLQSNYNVSALGLIGDKLSYLPNNSEAKSYPQGQPGEEPIYERRADIYGRLPFGTRLHGEIRQVKSFNEI